jgi:hypothetical protein
MLCALTVRCLKPGTYEQFRAAWQPQPWPDFLRSAYLVRNQDDEDEVAAFGFIDLSVDELEALRDDPSFLSNEAARMERISAFEESVILNAIYEVAEEIVPPGAESVG